MTEKYENCISLGWFCGTASAMEKQGLRSNAGPFDWMYSDFESVLKMIENDFRDFMLKENLQLVKDNPKVFEDIKYGFYCNHDIHLGFEEEYPEIFEKYKKRAERFMQLTGKPTCFLRTVRTEKEVAYIKENVEYIRSVIKKNNENNEIVFILTKSMSELTEDFMYFRLEQDGNSGEIYEMRTMFDFVDELVEYCQNSILSEEKIRKNIFYDKEFMGLNTKSGLIIQRAKEKNDFVALALQNYFPNIYTDGIYLWGAGNYGLIMSGYMIEHGMKINAIFDSNKEKIGTEINGVPVCSFSEIESGAINIFIAISNARVVNDVMERINSTGVNVKILTFAEIYGYAGIPDLSWY